MNLSKAQPIALLRYEAMCQAIANAHQVDEIKDLRDKALAIELYTRQAKNTEAERQAREIRLRAERKAGQLLAEMDKVKGGRPANNPSPDTRGCDRPLKDMGISHDQSSKWQRLAAIPEKDFETALADPDQKHSTNSLIAAHEEKQKPSSEETAPNDSRMIFPEVEAAKAMAQAAGIHFWTYRDRHGLDIFFSRNTNISLYRLRTGDGDDFSGYWQVQLVLSVPDGEFAVSPGGLGLQLAEMLTAVAKRLRGGAAE